MLSADIHKAGLIGITLLVLLILGWKSVKNEDAMFGVLGLLIVAAVSWASDRGLRAFFAYSVFLVLGAVWALIWPFIKQGLSAWVEWGELHPAENTLINFAFAGVMLVVGWSAYW